MAIENIDTFVDKIIKGLEQAIDSHKKNPTDTLEEVIADNLAKAFQQASEDQRNLLYKKLSLKLAADKIKMGKPFSNDIMSYLEEQTAFGIFSRVLNNLKDNPSTAFTKAITNPIAWLMEAIQKYLIIISLKSQIKSTQKIPGQEGNVSALKTQLETVRKELNQVAPFFGFVESMSSGLDRYPQPLRFIANTISWAINIALVFFIGITFISCLVFTIPSALLGAVTNFLTNWQYQREIDKYKQQVFQKYKAAYLQARRVQDINLTDKTDADVEEVLLAEIKYKKINITDSQAAQELNNAINKTIIINVFLSLKLQGRALLHSIVYPYSEHTNKNKLAIFSSMDF